MALPSSAVLEDPLQPADAEVSRPALGLVTTAVIVLGLALRAWIAWGSHLGVPDADEAIVANMARSFLHGHVSAFYWGQSYGGTGEDVLIAVVFRWMGPSATSLRVVPLGLGLASVWLTWRIGLRTLGESAARTAAALASLWPLGAAYWSTKARGFYGVALVLCLLTLLLALRLADVDAPARARRRDWILLGLVVGVAWWTSPLCMVVVAPALLWLLARRRPGLQEAVGAAAAAIVGMLPWLAWNVGHQWGSLSTTPQIRDHNGYLDHLRLFVVRGIPLALGLRAPESGRWVLGAIVGPILVVAAVAGLTVVAMRTSGPARLLVLVVAAYPFLLAVSPYSWFLDDTRYLYLLEPMLALLVAAGLVRYRAEIVGLGVAVVLSVLGLRALGEHRQVDVRPLARALEQRHVDRVAADYWVAYPLDLATRGRIVGTPVTGSVRSREAAAQVRQGARVAVVWTAGSVEEQQFLRVVRTDQVIESFAVTDYHVFVVDQRVAAPFVLPVDVP